LGWKEGQAVGKNPDGLVKPIDLSKRPALLGLGATPNPLVPEKKSNRPMLPGDKQEVKRTVHSDPVLPPPRKEREVQGQGLKRGDLVLIIGGRHKQLRGKVMDLTEKKGGLAVKVVVDGDVVRVWDDQVEVVRNYWIRPHIKVRIVSRSYRDGKYYNEKCVVQDVVTRGKCTLKTSKGAVLDNVDQSYLETIIPKTGKQVMILRSIEGARAGELAKLLETYSKSESALLQMESTFDMEKFSYDDFSEYVDQV